MIKKIIFVLLLLISLGVKAKQIEDKVTIEKLDVNMTLIGNHEYLVSNTYDVKTIFGITPNERYFYKLLKKDYVYYSEKEKKYDLEYYNYDIKTDINYGKNITEEGMLIYVGEGNKYLYEKQTIKIGWQSIIKNTKDKDIPIVISDEQYDVNKITFEIFNPECFNNKRILFSTNNKDYKENTLEIIYSLENNNCLLKGVYSKVLKENEILSFIIEDKTLITANKDNNFMFYMFIIIFFILLMYLIFMFIRKKINRIDKL